jgi:predicted PurR-regulated permease PerM
LSITPLAVFLALFVFGWALGPVGGLLAVPLLVLLITFVLQSSESTRWLADLMRVGKPPDPSDTQEPAAQAQGG